MSHRGNFNLPQDEARGDFMLFPKEKSPISLARKAAAYFEMCSVWELTISAVLVLFMMGLRVAHILRHNFDSDEPQYLHVIWGWTHGLIPYRDLFDNHMPLFYLMLAPFVGLIGEQATILYQMRGLLHLSNWSIVIFQEGRYLGRDSCRPLLSLPFCFTGIPDRQCLGVALAAQRHSAAQ